MKRAFAGHKTISYKGGLIAVMLTLLLPAVSFTQNVGVGTSTPHATAVLEIDVQANPGKGFLVRGTQGGQGSVPDLGAGKRLMYYPGKAAFRAGQVSYTQWDNINVGSNSFAVGSDTKASGIGSSAFGNEAAATGNYSTAMGHQTHATGQGSMASGMYSQASGYVSTALGYGSHAWGKQSTAIGTYLTARGYSSTVVGAYNNEITDTAQTVLTSKTPLFIVGNGTSFMDRSNALVVLANGKIGLGVDAPGNPLSFPPVLGKKISLYPGASGDVGFAVFGNQLQIYSDNPTSWVRLGYDQNGTFTNNLDVYGNGNAWLRGTLTQNSDARLKKDVQHINGAMQQLQQIKGYYYHWKAAERDRERQVGLLAQEVSAVFPELVRADKEGILSVNYIGLIPYLLEAVKEQQNAIDIYREKVDGLEKDMSIIKEQLKALRR